MARAAFYYYLPGAACVFCCANRKQKEEMIVVSHHVEDLDDRTAPIPAHRGCYRRRILLVWFRFVAAGLAVFICLGGLEAALRYAWHRPAYLSLPLALTVMNVVVGVLAGALSALRAYGRFLAEINEYIQLRTYPYD